MEPEDVLQLQTVLLKLKRLSRRPVTPLPLTRADSVAENVGTAIAQQIPRGNIDMPAAIANVVAPYTALRTDTTGLGMPNFNVGMPTSLAHLDYPVNTVPTGSTNVPEPPIDIPVTVAPNTIPDADSGMPRGNSPDLLPIVRPKRMWSFPLAERPCWMQHKRPKRTRTVSASLPHQNTCVMPGMGMSNMRLGMPTTSLGMPTTDPSEVQYPIMHPVTSVDLTAPDTIPPPSIGPGMPRGYSPPLLPMVTTATLLMPRGNSPPLLPMVTTATLLPQRRLLYSTPRKRTRRRAVSATTPHRSGHAQNAIGHPRSGHAQAQAQAQTMEGAINPAHRARRTSYGLDLCP